MTGLLIAAGVGLLVVWALCRAAASPETGRTCPLQDWDAAYVRELSDVKL